jgi:hypothetical protein
MKADRQSFMEQLFHCSEGTYKVLNGTALFRTRYFTVKITPSASHNINGQYNGLLVELVNPGSGVFERTFFKFQDHMVHKTSTHPNADPTEDLKVIEHCGWEWYINKPTNQSYERLVNKITEYINMF